MTEIETYAKARAMAKAAGFVLIAEIDGFYYYYERITGVMYVTRTYNQRFGMSVMLDPTTGLPLTVGRFIELGESSN